MPHPWLKRNVATMANLWTDPEHALDYLGRADTIPHRAEGESVLLDHLSDQLDRVLDLGCGDGRLLALVLSARPGASGMALDFSPAMLEKAQMRFSDHPSVEVRAHDLDQPLSLTGPFDAVVSSFAIHHVSDRRKQNLYSEVFDLLGPGGIFLNLEHVASPTERLHHRFVSCLGQTPEQEDPSNQLAGLEPQLGWLRAIGFEDVDCHWKWLELALMAGVRPGAP